MHYDRVNSILSKNNGMNLFRGCSHGCIYCDSRSDVYSMDHDFEDVLVKENAIDLFKSALRRKKEKCMIATGSMSDPYIPIEEDLCMTRTVLDLINRYGHGFTCITKSDLILRDLELLEEINQKSKVVVGMTLTCCDDRLSKIIEPNVCTTSRRVEVLRILQEHNIPTVVWLCPVLPYITDSVENISGILDSCIDVGVQGIICFNMGMTLRSGNREYFYEKLDEHFPGLREIYENKFGNSYGILSPNNKELMDLFYKKTNEHNILNKPNVVFKFLNEFPHKKFRQTKLF